MIPGSEPILLDLEKLFLLSAEQISKESLESNDFLGPRKFPKFIEIQFFGHYSKCRQPFWTIFGHMKALGFPELPIQLRDLNSKE